MAARGILGSSNMAVLLQNKGIFQQNPEGLIRPASSSVGFLGSQSVMNFSQGHCTRIRQPLFWPIELDESANTDMDDCLNHPEKKRRLTEDQVQFLEKSFENENKLEPERKIQLAKDLGLPPRQVAIWFQNRRARWKTKQLEKDYEDLRRSYDVLKNDYDSTLKEKEELQAKVISLTNILLRNEKNDEKLEFLDGNKVVDKFPKLESNIEAEVKQVEKFTTVCKQEDISSANSIVLDSESPQYIDGGYSMMMTLTSCSTAFGHDQSEQSQVGEVDMAKGCDFFALQDNSANYDSEVEDQALWTW